MTSLFSTRWEFDSDFRFRLPPALEIVLLFAGRRNRKPGQLRVPLLCSGGSEKRNPYSEAAASIGRTQPRFLVSNRSPPKVAGAPKVRDPSAQGDALGISRTNVASALKGRNFLALISIDNRSSMPRPVSPRWGEHCFAARIPRASPWAIESDPFGVGIHGGKRREKSKTICKSA